jgi:hypothetical protein
MLRMLSIVAFQRSKKKFYLKVPLKNWNMPDTLLVPIVFRDNQNYPDYYDMQIYAYYGLYANLAHFVYLLSSMGSFLHLRLDEAQNGQFISALIQQGTSSL